MKVNFLTYLNPLRYSGGGEKISSALISEMRRRNWKVRIISARPMRLAHFRDANVNILCDVDNRTAFPRKIEWCRFPAVFLNYIKSCSEFNIHFSNAYVDLCGRDYLPCNADRRHCSCIQLNAHRRAMLNSDVDMAIYLSPLHRDTSVKVLENFGMSLPKIVEVMGPCIDTTIFYDQGLSRDIEYLFVGVIGEAKGLSEIREKYATKDIHFIGKVENGQKLDFGTYHGFLPYSDIARFMNRAKKFVFLPRWNEPQGRVVHEAALCGCEIVGNSNIGATSFDFDLGKAENYVGNEKLIVDKIEFQYMKSREKS